VEADDAAPHGPIWHGATVLVVDDNLEIRELTRRTLEAQGFHVVEAVGRQPTSPKSFPKKTAHSVGVDRKSIFRQRRRSESNR
jgi:response regulator RpfG family c-di-GMP phosphodiesterase